MRRQTTKGSHIDGQRVLSVRRILTVSASLIAAMTVVLSADLSIAHAEAQPTGLSGDWSLALNEEFSSNGLNTTLWTPGWQHGGISGPMAGMCASSSLVSQPGNGYLYLSTTPANGPANGSPSKTPAH
jgi:hypothetical protein